MLEKIIAIKNVGRFKNSRAAGDFTFRRFTFIFAENGRGKTTLCAILRSLFTNTPSLLLGRTTLGSTEPPEAQFLFGGANISFRNGAWSAAYPNIAVFDGMYVNDNVFAGDVVDTDHRRNLYRVIIGTVGVTLAARSNDLDNEIRAKNNEIRELRGRIQRYVPDGVTVDAFIALPEDPAIDIKIGAKEQELQAVRDVQQLQARAGMTPVGIPIFPAAFAGLLAKTFAVVAVDAETRVSEHLVQHQMQAHGGAWLTEGLQYVNDEACPFCGQGLAGVDLIRAYRDFFSREYHALRDEVTALLTQIETALGDRVVAAIEQTLLQNSNNVEFWNRYCELTPPIAPDAGRLAECLIALRHASQALLRIKAGTPLEAVPPDEGFTQALTAFEELRVSIGAYNASIAGANAIIATRKRETQAANAREVESALARLKAQKARHSEDVRVLCASDATLQVGKTALETEKDRVRVQLDTHTAQVITRYGQSINRYLERINAGFSITTPTHNYRGGQPSTSYQIVINQNNVDLGDAATAHDRPSFRNTLSAGDRSTLALAFFLAQLDLDPDRAAKTVVFDDPFTSLDSFRRNHTVHQIRRCGDTCAQVIVLSHDAAFLKLLWDRVVLADRKTIQLCRVGEENTAIAEWDIEKAVQARYKADIDALQRFFSVNDGLPRNLIQKIRPVLEGYCRNLFPVQFGEQEMMGGIVGKIRTAGVPHPLFPIVEDLDELNIYCRRYHHADNPNAATEAVDDAELQGYVKRTLKLVGCLL